MDQDVRWKQRFNNYANALRSLQQAVELSERRPLSELEQQGLIQGFEFTHELAWNVLKDYLSAQGLLGLIGSRDATREAFKNGLIADGETWMAMIRARNLSSHSYNLKLAQEISQDICKRFYPAFILLEQVFATLAAKHGTDS